MDSGSKEKTKARGSSSDTIDDGLDSRKKEEWMRSVGFKKMK